MTINDDLIDLKLAIETYKELKSILNIELNYSCRHTVLDKKFKDKYGIEITSLSAAVIQLFYEIGKEDAIKELKDKL